MAQGDRRVHGLARQILWVCLAGVSAGGWASSALSQDAKTMLVVPPSPLLPQQAGDWVRQSDAAAASPIKSDEKLDQILNEDGLKRSEQAVYRVGDAGPLVAVTARQFVDATGAHAAYNYFGRPGSVYRGVGLGEETTLNGDRYVFRSGGSVVEATGARGPKVEALLNRIQIGLPKVSGPKGLAPTLPTLLPQKGLDRDSVKYALGPISYESMGGILPGAILGFDKAAEAVMAKYAGRGSLTMLLYPTPEIAGDRLRAIEAEIRRLGRSAGTVVMRRSGNLLMITTGQWTLPEAKALVQGIHPRVEVTWNKPMPPEFHVEVRKTYSLLSSIAIFCGFGALAAVVLGLSLGAGRAAIRVLQGKPAATEPEFLRIDLSGRQLPIQAEGRGSGVKG
ncbi:DUF6599 family protein [Edaphobacter modestus]|uniref:Uncharacterized protein n=1 Tax=Edaphobacter modestus TaxID=388466 RepID=A0A4V2G4R8_9BACT|nr:DUF6599 family protein [Edaphobacter modestus]RZU41476.1 hypothetical protein BDD14_2999 [Edaphobacter modestus]